MFDPIFCDVATRMERYKLYKQHPDVVASDPADLLAFACISVCAILAWLAQVTLGQLTVHLWPGFFC